MHERDEAGAFVGAAGGAGGGETELVRYTSQGVAKHVEAGLDDLRRAYAELHQEMAAPVARPPQEQERIRAHVRFSPPHCLIRLAYVRPHVIAGAGAHPRARARAPPRNLIRLAFGHVQAVPRVMSGRRQECMQWCFLCMHGRK